jgi:hypothetical protein
MQKMKHNYDINDPANVDLIDEEAMDNMYRLITKQDTYDSISVRKGRVLMIINPMDDDTDMNELIETLIEYYSAPDIEMYERCAELVKIKKSKSGLKSIQKALSNWLPADLMDFDPNWDIEDDNDR